MDPTEAFTAVVTAPEPELDLARAALLIAAHARPGLDVDVELARLDQLASGCDDATLAGLGRHLVDGCGFVGNTRDYYDPRNSYLDVVLTRRTGIPITLSLLGVEVGRRLGLRVAGVGMPGHFLVRTVDQPEFLDLFHGSALLDEPAVRELFARLFRGGRPFAPRFLDPVGPRAILSRMLTNLVGAHLRRGEPAAAARAARLRLALPGLPTRERAELAGVLAQLGHLDEAAGVLESAAADSSGPSAQALAGTAKKLRSRRN
jgi:regulator of sirC expression with transglutaminase-like and TPR domain